MSYIYIRCISSKQMTPNIRLVVLVGYKIKANYDRTVLFILHKLLAPALCSTHVPLDTGDTRPTLPLTRHFLLTKTSSVETAHHLVNFHQ